MTEPRIGDLYDITGGGPDGPIPARVVALPDGTLCWAWSAYGDPAIRPVTAFPQAVKTETPIDRDQFAYAVEVPEQALREARAAALREAAKELDLPGSDATGYYSGAYVDGYREAERHIEQWLRARADRIDYGIRDADGAFVADARTTLPAALNALEAVLRAHYDDGPSQGYFGDPAPYSYGVRAHCCSTCGTHGEYGVEWPCPTVRAIAEALGVEP